MTGVPQLVWWLVLACFGPVPDYVAGSMPDPRDPANCELQSYARPGTLAADAYVAVCPYWIRPDVKHCLDGERLKRVGDLEAADWVAGEKYNVVTMKGVTDVFPARSIVWGQPGPAPMSWVNWTAGAWCAGAAAVLVLLGLLVLFWPDRVRAVLLDRARSSPT